MGNSPCRIAYIKGERQLDALMRGEENQNHEGDKENDVHEYLLFSMKVGFHLDHVIIIEHVMPSTFRA